MTATPTRTSAQEDKPGPRSAGTASTDRAVVRIAALGLVSALLITGASAMRGWPFPSLTASPWFFQISASGPLRYLFVALFYAGVAGMCWSWVRLLGLARQERLSVRAAFVIFGAWSAALFLSAPLFSGDVYVYFVDGEALLRGFNPYEVGVSAMGPAAEVHMVHPLWRSTTTMYGPIFMRMAEVIALWAGGSVITGVLMLKFVATASVALMAVCTVSLARSLGRNPVEAMAFAVLNPLTMLHLVGGAHNDAMMLGLLFAGFAVGVRANSVQLRVVALLLCTAGAAMKMPAFAGALVLGWIWAGVGAGLGRRIAGAALAGAGSVLLFGVITLAAGLGMGWVNAIDVPGLAHPVLAPANALSKSFGTLFGIGVLVDNVARTSATLLSLVIAIAAVVRTRRNGQPVDVLRATGWALLALAWLGPAVYPWYLTWGVAVIGAAGPGALRRPLVIAVVAASFVIAPGGYGLLDSPGGALRTVVAFVTLGVMVWAVRVVLRQSDIHPIRFLRRGWAIRRNLTLRGLIKAF